jgi:hypothetical protein
MGQEKPKDDRWIVRGVHPDVRKQVRLYAVEHDITVAQALKELVELALAVLSKEK